MSAVRRSKQLPWLDRTTSRLASAWPPSRGDYPATVEATTGIVRAIERETGCQGTVGVDMPGSISPTTGLIKGSNSVWMTGHPFRDGLEAALSRPVRCANDANCASVEDASLSRARHKHVSSSNPVQAAE
jgi:predicted NBD/HSP70 family sugar kinase